MGSSVDERPSPRPFIFRLPVECFDDRDQALSPPSTEWVEDRDPLAFSHTGRLGQAWTCQGQNSFAERLVAFAAVEGVFGPAGGVQSRHRSFPEIPFFTEFRISVPDIAS